MRSMIATALLRLLICSSSQISRLVATNLVWDLNMYNDGSPVLYQFFWSLNPRNAGLKLCRLGRPMLEMG
jgi:hypothetical protein